MNIEVKTIKDEPYNTQLIAEIKNFLRKDWVGCNGKIPARNSKTRKHRCFSRSDLGAELKIFTNKHVLIVLTPSQLNILGQVFRPIICAKVKEATSEYVEIEDVNIRMSNAPDFKFPTPLLIPLNKIAVFSPFDHNEDFPLT